ncbi:MAG TPA: protein-L-isoaspartate(D-aspartate) O-methyltransferase [Euzebyales bacterium]
MPVDDLWRAARAAGVSDRRLLDAIGRIPRRAFVPPAHADRADVDAPIPIAHDQVTTQPSLSARMLEALDLTDDDHALEVGTGQGYQTALLATLTGSVVSVERFADLAAVARTNLERQGIDNVEVIVSDGTRGWPPGAPYDAIIVSAAFPRVPRPLVEQLCEDGRLVQPIGRGGADDVVLFHRTAAGLRRVRRICPAHFVRLVGELGYSSEP